MTLGGITGLQDCLLLPPVRAHVEDNYAREYLVLTCLRMQAQAGTRPKGIAVDNLEQCFQGIARCLQAAFPAQVHLLYGEEWPLADGVEPEDDQIYIQMSQKKTAGIWLCEDPLHCYKRLMEAVNFASREAPFLARSLQALLASWNPARRLYGKEYLAIGKKMPIHISWIHFTPWEMDRPSVVSDVLTSYFCGLGFPPSAHEVLLRDFKAEWRHPQTDKVLPSCSKVVIYRDVAKAAEKDHVKDCIKTGYSPDLVVAEIEQEFDALKVLFAERLFASKQQVEGSASGTWYKQQLKYLRHFRQRPVHSASHTKVKPGTEDEPAGGHNFSRVVDLQSSPTVTNGCLAKKVKSHSKEIFLLFKNEVIPDTQFLDVPAGLLRVCKIAHLMFGGAGLEITAQLTTYMLPTLSI